MKLHQLIAVINTVKANAAKAKTVVYHAAQKLDSFKGLSRTYQPLEDGGYVYPPESRAVQKKVESLISDFVQASTEFINLAATQDWANSEARGAIAVDGVTILEDVPVSHLLFLEKQLEDIKTFISSLPVLDLDKEWHYDSNRGVYATDPKQTAKTKKVTKPVVLYEATKEHPAQVKEASEDVVEGTWTMIEFSGALPQDRVNELLGRVNKLIKAVILAREEANNIEVRQKQVADSVFGYLFSE